GNIAHQWRQPLSVVSIITSGMIVKKDLNITNEEDDRKELKKIGDTVTYLSETIDDFKNFFKPDKEKKIFNVKDCYKKTMNLVDSRLDSLSIEVIEDLHDVQLNCLENELKQVIMNLLNNSKDALEQRDDHRRLIFIDIYEENDNAIFFIKDTGGGIPSDVINNIFKPYFSTKDKDQGTGIGLYMSIEMVEKHMNGQLLVENESFIYDSISYKGACFKIIIPQNL
ncbi:MAG: sensor histidine kinase, partial [Halarcobacter sp.]